MKTIIFKWNPAFSSYTILRFLKDLQSASEREEDDRKSNWSVWDHDKVSVGDRFYMLKVGYGQTGIVARGVVTSDAYEGEDWSFNDRKRYYVDYVPEFMINPDGMKLLTSKALSERIGDFDWFGGHSGLVLTDAAAAELERMWDAYVAEQNVYFEKASDDNLFIADDADASNNGYTIKFERDYDDLEIIITAESNYYGKVLRRRIEILDAARAMKKFKVGSKRMFVKVINQQYPTPNDLSRLCADLFTFGVNYRTRVYLLDDDDE